MIHARVEAARNLKSAAGQLLYCIEPEQLSSIVEGYSTSK